MTMDEWKSHLSRKQITDLQLDLMIVESDYWDDTSDEILLKNYSSLKETLVTMKEERDSDARKFYQMVANMILNTIEQRTAWLKHIETMIWIFIVAALVGIAYFCIVRPDLLPKI